MSAICDLPVFKISTPEIQDFVRNHVLNRISRRAAAEAGGVCFDRTAQVTLSDGSDFSASIVYHDPIVKPALSSAKLNGKTVYMVKGANPKLKSAKYFYAEDFFKSADVVQFLEEISAAIKKFKVDHAQSMIDYMNSNLVPIAKHALISLPNIAQEHGAAGIYNWLLQNQFDVSDFTEKFFEPLAAQLISTGEIREWIYVKETSARGQWGTCSSIDFINKKIKTHGWSSY